MISLNKQRFKYVIGDLFSSISAWFVYTFLRFELSGELMEMQGHHSFASYLNSPKVILGFLVFPVMMMAIYYLSGYYNEVFRKSRLQEFFVTFFSALCNSLVIFFVALVNDMAYNRGYNYEMILLLLVLLFLFVYVVRACITSKASYNIKNRIWQFNTLIIGAGSEAKKLGYNLNTMRQSIGNYVVGYVPIDGEENDDVDDDHVFDLDSIEDACKKHDVKELIVAPTNCDTKTVLDTINRLFILNLPIKITPSISDIILSRAKIQQIEGDPLVDVMQSSMGDCAKNLKRVADVIVSLLGMIILLPVYAVLAICVKLDSKGPIIYKQERVGFRNKPFNIYKFRSMVANAESNGNPQLSFDSDSRITKFGRFMRKYRLDETPQFWNILKGDMSLVGPRPERAYYVNQITEKVPFYSLVHQVRPGITSLGMVKYGYAKNVDEMIERLKFDLLYLENMSLLNDIKIMIYTIKIVLNGRGI